MFEPQVEIEIYTLHKRVAYMFEEERTQLSESARSFIIAVMMNLLWQMC